jgi:hypothetical protein
MNTEQINKRFAKLAGICWHKPSKPEYCDGSLGGRCKIIRDDNPDFCGDPRLVLEVMMKREDWYYHVGRTKYGFLLSLFKYHQEDVEGAVSSMLKNYILDTTGLLAMKAVEFMEGRNICKE